MTFDTIDMESVWRVQVEGLIDTLWWLRRPVYPKKEMFNLSYASGQWEMECAMKQRVAVQELLDVLHRRYDRWCKP